MSMLDEILLSILTFFEKRAIQRDLQRIPPAERNAIRQRRLRELRLKFQ